MRLLNACRSNLVQYPFAALSLIILAALAIAAIFAGGMSETYQSMYYNAVSWGLLILLCLAPLVFLVGAVWFLREVARKLSWLMSRPMSGRVNAEPLRVAVRHH